ncbi:MAG: nucleoside hydrolase [Alphaproteobacteria bacterium]|nr:nucleoside hydrolase [Alphaproteobacteria bacterium]
MRKHLAATLAGLVAIACMALILPASAAPEKIIIDTDIGDDIDDAFVVALALQSPEVELLGITTGFGDTKARAAILDRMLGETGHADIPVAIGTPSNANPGGFTQRAYGRGGHFARASHPAAVDFLLAQIRKYPGQITLVAVGPAPNIGELIARDPDAFRKLKRVVTMGGAIAPYDDGWGGTGTPHPEWNVKNDIPAQQKLYAAGVPVVTMPLDSTAHLKMDEVRRSRLFARGTPLSDALALLYLQWSHGTRQATPTLFDPMTLAWLLKPSLCPTTPMHIVVDKDGMTRQTAGPANAQVCLKSDRAAFMDFVMQRLDR